MIFRQSKERKASQKMLEIYSLVFRFWFVSKHPKATQFNYFTYLPYEDT